MRDSWRAPEAEASGLAVWGFRAPPERGPCVAPGGPERNHLTERHSWYLRCQSDISDKKTRNLLRNSDVGNIALEAGIATRAIKADTEMGTETQEGVCQACEIGGGRRVLWWGASLGSAPSRTR